MCTPARRPKIDRSIFQMLRCPNGAHKCFQCGKKGHGKGDCRTYDPPPDPVPSEKRPFTASTSTSVAMPVDSPRDLKKKRFSAIGKDVCPDGQSTLPSTLHEDLGEDAFAVDVTDYGSGNAWFGGAYAGEPIGPMRSTASVDASVNSFRSDGPTATANTSTSVAKPGPIDLMVWRPTGLNKHGFACLFQFSCTMMNRSRGDQMPLYIDLNQSNSLYDSFKKPQSRAVWWGDVFLQPYLRSLQNEPEKVKCVRFFYPGT